MNLSKPVNPIRNYAVGSVITALPMQPARRVPRCVIKRYTMPISPPPTSVAGEGLKWVGYGSLNAVARRSGYGALQPMAAGFVAGRTSPVLGRWYSPQLPVADFVYEGIRDIRYPLDGLEYHAEE
jgi:hypothetical protein